MTKIFIVIFAVLLIFTAVVFAINKISDEDQNGNSSENGASVDSMSSEEVSKSDELLADAFENNKSEIEVQGQGTVKRILPDDEEGSEHQKFILELSNGQTLLFAHNISLSKRIDDLKEGDTVTFAGEYVWNKEGGLVHWTHHDPDGSHKDGWLLHNGKRYD